MLYRILADCVVVIHFVFILFAIGGGLLVLRSIQCAWMHIPVVLYAALIEFWGWICPLTPFENWLRVKSGGAGYETSFIEKYIIPIIYPATLNRHIQIILGIIVLVINIWIYIIVIRRHCMQSTLKKERTG